MSSQTGNNTSVEMGLESGEDQPLTGPGSEGVETFDCRKAFAETLIELAREDKRVVAVCAGSPAPTASRVRSFITVAAIAGRFRTTWCAVCSTILARSRTAGRGRS